MAFDWRGCRDRALGSPAVRARIAALPGGRTIADRHGARLFTTMTGFAASRMLAAAIELGLFEALRRRTLSLDAIAATAALPPAGARALADAMLASGLWEARRGGLIGLTVDGLVVASEPGIAAMCAHDRLLYEDLVDPVAVLRSPGGGRLARFWPYRGGGDPAGYAALMAQSHTFAGAALADAHDFGRYRRVMDVGGGDGRFLRALAARWPALDLALVDLPSVAEAANKSLARSGIAVHARSPGEALPAGADAITLVRVLHDQDDANAALLLDSAARALAPGGTLIVAEPMRRRGRDPVAVYFAAYFAAMGSGRLRTPAEVATLLRRAGLRPARPRRVSFLLTKITATRA